MKPQLEQELAKLKHGDHICSIYENADEQMAAVVPFIIDGLARGERCVYIVNDRTIEEAVETLEAAGVDVAQERRRGALRLLTHQDTYLRASRFVPQAMIDFIRQAETEALADGFSGLRLTGEPTWSFGPEPGCDRLIEYEALLNQLTTNSKSVILCQYHHSRFGSPCIHDVLRTHPLAILGDQLCPNPYYEPPELVLSPEPQASAEYERMRAAWWIAQLERARVAEQERERALETLEQSRRRLAEAQQVAHIGSWERDLRTNEVTWSDELFRLFGLQSHEGSVSYERFLSFVLPQDASRIRALVDEAIRERGPLDFDYRITRADGSVRVLHEQGSAILNEAAEPVRLVGTAQDITERKSAEEALRQSEERLNLAVRAADLGIFQHDHLTDTVYWSPTLRAIFGREAQEVASLQAYFGLIQPQDRERIVAAVRQAHAPTGDGHFAVEHRIVRPDGGIRWVSVWSRTSFEGEGDARRPLRTIGIVAEITERKRAEEALRRSEDRIRSIIDAIPVMAWTLQPDGVVDFLNQRWTDYFGLSLEQYVEDPMRPIHPEDILRAVEKWRVQMAAGEGHEDEMRLRRRDGEYRWFLVRTEPQRDEQGKIVKWFGVSTDIDDRKQAEQAVKESQQLLHMVLATLPVGVAVTDRAGDIVLDNPACKRIWGDMIVSGGERRARSKGCWHDSGKRIDPEGWASARALSGGQTSLNELIDIVSFDGQQKTIQNSAVPIRNAEGSIVGAVVVNEDVTERVRAQKALRESADRLQNLSRRLLEVQEEERRHLSRELHDEFGQILATITLHLHAARGLAGDAARPRLDECTVLLRQAGEQVRSLALELRPTMLDTLGLEAALRWLAEQHQQRTGCPVQVVGHLSGTPPSPELAIACFRVAQEALTNVIRHAAAPHVWIELSQSESVLELVVRDDGVGFDMILTQDKAARRESLGLLGMRERVEILGGTLLVESEPGRGTRLRVSFPSSEVPEGPADPQE
jgi:PAS domain S-box-containing protein